MLDLNFNPTQLKMGGNLAISAVAFAALPEGGVALLAGTLISAIVQMVKPVFVSYDNRFFGGWSGTVCDITTYVSIFAFSLMAGAAATTAIIYAGVIGTVQILLENYLTVSPPKYSEFQETAMKAALPLVQTEVETLKATELMAKLPPILS